MNQGIGAAADAQRMQRLVNFYEKLPRGAAPEPQASGPISWYRKRYFSGKGSPARTSCRSLKLHPIWR